MLVASGAQAQVRTCWEKPEGGPPAAASEKDTGFSSSCPIHGGHWPQHVPGPQGLGWKVGATPSPLFQMSVSGPSVTVSGMTRVF